MKITILGIGRIKNGAERDLAARYWNRSSRILSQYGFTLCPAIQILESKERTKELRQKKEAEKLLSICDKETYLCLLDENGENVTSQNFSDFLKELQLVGNKSLTFVIGGPDGHSLDIKRQANKIIKLGSMTWPHQLVHILLSEQIYRAATIFSNHPYHRS